MILIQGINHPKKEGMVLMIQAIAFAVKTIFLNT